MCYFWYIVFIFFWIDCINSLLLLFLYICRFVVLVIIVYYFIIICYSLFRLLQYIIVIEVYYQLQIQFMLGCSLCFFYEWSKIEIEYFDVVVQWQCFVFVLLGNYDNYISLYVAISINTFFIFDFNLCISRSFSWNRLW